MGRDRPGGKDSGALYVSKVKNESVWFTFSKNSKDRLGLSGWNSTFAIKAPPAAQISTAG